MQHPFTSSDPRITQPHTGSFTFYRRTRELTDNDANDAAQGIFD